VTKTSGLKQKTVTISTVLSLFWMMYLSHLKVDQHKKTIRNPTVKMTTLGKLVTMKFCLLCSRMIGPRQPVVTAAKDIFALSVLN
jgi:hypothetical protein